MQQQIIEKLEKMIESTPLGGPRREVLITEMQELESQKKDCFSCSGMCCTYEFNSMLITPLETIELIIYLFKENRLNKKLLEDLDANTAKYRLDKELNLGRNREFRRYYTCPFFKNQSAGCSISRSAKPYGCLGFNPKTEKVDVEGKCFSNQDLLETRTLQFEKIENLSNEYLSKELGIYWTKKAIPTAIVELIHKLGLIT